MAEPLFNHGGEFDVLLAHFGPNGLRASWYRDAGLIKGPLVTVFHGYDLTVFLRNREDSVYDPLFKTGELFLPISGFWRDRLQLLGCPPSKIKVHHVGIDCDYFSFKPRTREVDKPTILISVARLVEKKGIEIALHAFARLVDLGLNVQYRIIGDGPLLESLEQFVSKKGLGQYVKFLGARMSGEVVVELNRAHVFLAPSVTSQTGDMEGIPTVLMEAMAVGMPVVSTLHSGIPELVEDGISGKLVKERDVVGLVQALKELVADVEHWPTLGANGRKKVLQEFNIKSLNEQLVSLIELLR
jgi:colanic acid/amylovoran biosynthesis glycosyltransferase